MFREALWINTSIRRNRAVFLHHLIVLSKCNLYSANIKLETWKNSTQISNSFDLCRKLRIRLGSCTHLLEIIIWSEILLPKHTQIKLKYVNNFKQMLQTIPIHCTALRTIAIKLDLRSNRRDWHVAPQTTLKAQIRYVCKRPLFPRASMRITVKLRTWFQSQRQNKDLRMILTAFKSLSRLPSSRESNSRQIWRRIP